jgi:hypothetical protein
MRTCLEQTSFIYKDISHLIIQWFTSAYSLHPISKCTRLFTPEIVCSARHEHVAFRYFKINMSTTPHSLETGDIKEMDTTKQIEVVGELTWTPEEEKKLVRKVDLLLMPTIWLMYLLSYMDRTNIGNARQIFTVFSHPETVLTFYLQNCWHGK